MVLSVEGRGRFHTCVELLSVLIGSSIEVALKHLYTVTVILPTPNRDLLSPDTLLRCLYPGDSGEDTPNPSNKYAFQRLG